MRKFLVSLCVFSFLYFSLSAQVINFFTPEKPDISFKQNIQFNLLQDSKEYGMGISTIVDFDFQELYTSVGANLLDNQTDFTTNVRYSPTLFGRYQLGVAFNYHRYVYRNYFTEQDYFIDCFAKCRFSQIFEMYLCYGFFKKSTRIDAIKDYIPDLVTKDMNFNMLFTFFPSDLWTVYASFGSFDYFNYPRFFTAFITTGAEFQVIEDKFSVGMDLSTKWYDFIVVAQNVGQVNIKIFGRYKL